MSFFSNVGKDVKAAVAKVEAEVKDLRAKVASAEPKAVAEAQKVAAKVEADVKALEARVAALGDGRAHDLTACQLVRRDQDIKAALGY